MQYDKTRMGKIIGVAVLALTIGLPAMERAGYCGFLGYASDSQVPVLWALATLGGALGGALLAGHNYRAGFLGGLLAAYFFTLYGTIFDREALGSAQFVLFQFVGTIPGYALYRMLRLDEPYTTNISELTTG